MAPSEAWRLTLRELVVMADGLGENEWDHTATLASLVHNLVQVTVAMHTGKRQQGVTMSDYHPYVDGQKRGLRITADKLPLLASIVAHARRS